MIFQVKCFSCYILSKSHCLIAFTSRDIGQHVHYNCLLTRLDVIKFEINLIFLTKPFRYMTKKSRQKLKYLENEKSFWGDISIFHHFTPWMPGGNKKVTQLKAAGLFKYVWSFCYHQLLKGERPFSCQKLSQICECAFKGFSQGSLRTAPNGCICRNNSMQKTQSLELEHQF